MKKVLPHVVAGQNPHENWRTQHRLMLAQTTEEMDVLEQFIKAQEESGDACSSRLMESKRALDGLLADLKSLSTQVDSHEEVLETETGNLNITELSVKAVDVTHAEAMATCEKETQDAVSRVSQYQSELAELDQIAKPSVRYEHVTKVTVSTKVTESTTESNNSLLQNGIWTKDACLAFLQFQKRKHVKHAGNTSVNQDPDLEDTKEEKDCDAEREDLQKAFTEAYITTRDLLKEAQSDVQDTTCVDTANAKKAADLVPLISERERAASLIESSSESLAALDPILELVDRRVEKLSDHIYNVLTPECAQAKEVSEALQKIRELILLLEECPGRNNFKLKIPEETPEAEEEEAIE
jgi:hypothetical protein